MKIICVGRNYVKHIHELKNTVLDEPAIFLKPETSLLTTGKFCIPDFSSEIHHEVELVYRIGKTIKNTIVKNALDFVDAITVGLDFTARDVQDKLKDRRLSWELSKAFDNAACLGEFIPVAMYTDLNNINFRLEINQKVVQQGNSKYMIFSIEHILSYVSKYITIYPGDVVFTGTPEGVGKVAKGDLLTAYLFDQKLIELNIDA